MGILDFFKSKPPPEEPPYRMFEREWSLNEHKYQVRVRKGGREFYAEDLFKAAATPKDLKFDRFVLLNEKPAKPHFAPSLQEAVNWFRGRNLSKNGYDHIYWGDKYIYTCAICQARRATPLRITEMEHMTVTTVIPKPLAIEGWRVTEVETELTGKGTPTEKLDIYKTFAVVKWHQAPNQYLCQNCARRLADMGQESKVADYFVFEAK
jgi:hypothetical protein